MPLAEILTRSSQQATDLEDRLRVAMKRAPRLKCRNNPHQVVDRCMDLVPGVNLLTRSASENTDFISVIETEKERVLQRANDVFTGKVQLLGIDFTVPPTDWNLDPGSGHSFEQAFRGAVKTHQHGKNRIDVKHPWELGRFQYLVPVAQSYLFDRDNRSPQVVTATIESWIDSQPYATGIHWTSALEVAIRGISWIWCLACIGKSNAVEETFLTKVTESLWQHGHALHRNLSYYSSPYNHLIGECCALYMLAIALQDVFDTSPWMRRARQTLTGAIDHQFYEDGFTLEQSSSYQYFTLGFLSLTAAAATQDSAEFPLQSAIGKAVVAGNAFESETGEWAAIGDSDSARAIPVFPESEWDFSGVATLASVLANETSFPKQVNFSELLWTLGESGLRNFEKLEHLHRQSSTYFPDAGYAIYSNDRTWVCLDGGEIADGLHSDDTPSTAHGHLDQLQVLASLDGLPFLIDSGMPHYFQSESAADYFRGIAAHNTIEFQGHPPATVCGPLMWNRVQSECSIYEPQVMNGVWCSQATLKFKTHTDAVQRSVLVKDEFGLIVVDTIPEFLLSQAIWHWHISPERKTKPSSETAYCHTIDDYRLYTFTQSGSVEVAQLNTPDDPIRSSISKGYGHTAAHCHLTSKVHGQNSNKRPSRTIVHGWVKSGRDVEIQIEGDSCQFGDDLTESHEGTWRINLVRDNAGLRLS
ncbi:hypothetical protein CGZ80_19210 [Rhodopirellula sp. MGV]|nr:hypothetical protein CGZ80_19210 [Rhodopirellula sp. MGV]PNY35319.1 hypothetical protein C2E31_17475 [Rhodopirellula baltica]